jgi:tRNA(Phe) wybutosine-synthesizing methylase Tyw3
METKLRIINRYDHINNWERINPTLAIGEIIVVIFQDRSIKIKVGDGGLFSNTPYITDSLTDIINEELFDIKERLDSLEENINVTNLKVSEEEPQIKIQNDIWFDI